MVDEQSGRKARAKNSGTGAKARGRSDGQTVLAALDLGTNNCRLLIATPSGRGFRIVDAFSNIVRLGEGLSRTGRLNDAAMERTLAALRVCAEKISRRGATHVRCIATQACRSAENGPAFIERVRAETGLSLEIISAEEEARLAVSGCEELIDNNHDAALIFDIGGGSTELSWLAVSNAGARPERKSWASLPLGVVTLSETWGGAEISSATYEKIVASARASIAALGDPGSMREKFSRAHFVGTSGTVTSIAGVYLGLSVYRRDKVDGLWLTADDVRQVSAKLRAMTLEDRASEPCIGRERADLVVCGCAILEALLLEWPVERIRVADRGLREGILHDLGKKARRQRRRRARARKRGKVKAADK